MKGYDSESIIATRRIRRLRSLRWRSCLHQQLIVAASRLRLKSVAVDAWRSHAAVRRLGDWFRLSRQRPVKAAASVQRLKLVLEGGRVTYSRQTDKQ